MTSIVAYRKVSTPHTVIQMLLPDSQGADDGIRCTELAAIDGVTYVAVPDGMLLPEQPPELTIEPVTLTADLRGAIKAASPHCDLIAERMIQQIRSCYSAEDESYYARIGVGSLMGVYEFEPGEEDDLLAFGAYVEGVRAWGRAERAKLGLP